MPYAPLGYQMPLPQITPEDFEEAMRIRAQMGAPQAPSRGPRVPLSGVFEPGGQQMYAQPSAPEPPGRFRALNDIQPYPLNLPATLEGLGVATGMHTGAPGAVRAGMDALHARVPLGFNIAGGAAGAGLGMAPSETAGEPQAQPGAPQPGAKQSADPRIGRIKEYDQEVARNQKILLDIGSKEFKSRTARELATRPYNDAISQAQEAKKALTDQMDKEQTEQQKTFRDTAIGSMWPYVQWGGPIAAAMLTKGAVRLDERAAARPATEAVRKAEQAMEGGGLFNRAPDLDRARYYAGKAVEEAKYAEPGAFRSGMHEAAPYAAGMGVGLEASLLPSQYNLYNSPEGSPPHEEAKQALHFPEIVGTALRGVVPAAFGAFTGTHMPNIPPPRYGTGAAENLREWLARNPSPSSAPPAPPTAPMSPAGAPGAAATPPGPQGIAGLPPGYTPSIPMLERLHAPPSVPPGRMTQTTYEAPPVQEIDPKTGQERWKDPRTNRYTTKPTE